MYVTLAFKRNQINIEFTSKKLTVTSNIPMKTLYKTAHHLDYYYQIVIFLHSSFPSVTKSHSDFLV